MWVLAHIGKIPVEEWLPFLVPVIALYLYGRHHNRRHERALERLPPIEQGLDDHTTRLVLDEWRKAKHEHLTAEHVPLFYPPGPDGASPSELAARTRQNRERVTQQLEDLQELDYLNLDATPNDDEQPCASLTIEGYGVLSTTEQALLAAHGIRPA